MAKVVYVPLRNAKLAKTGSVVAKRVKDADGKTVILHTVDADSQTFSDDISYVFQQNVRKARQKNKRLVGPPDLATTKA